MTASKVTGVASPATFNRLCGARGGDIPALVGVTQTYTHPSPRVTMRVRVLVFAVEDAPVAFTQARKNLVGCKGYLVGPKRHASTFIGPLSPDAGVASAARWARVDDSDDLETTLVLSKGQFALQIDVSAPAVANLKTDDAQAVFDLVANSFASWANRETIGTGG